MADEGGADEEAQNVAPVETVETVEGGEENEAQAVKGEEDEAQAETEGENSTASITDEQWKGMATVIRSIYDFREDDGNDPSKIFQRMVNKRNFPEYFELIKEPMALSKIKQKMTNKEYTGFQEFVHDCALIIHNAQTFNRPESGAFQDAVVLKPVFESEIQKLVEAGVVKPEDATWPDLGEIPPVSPRALEEEEEEGEGEEEDEEDEEDEEPDDSDDEGGRRKRKRGPRGTAAITKRESGAKDDKEKATDPDSRKKRGRPPRVDTPMEARIKAILKGIRKFKDASGQFKTRHFERLPDKAVMPEYFTEIKEPMAIDLIKRKSKRKKYNSVDHFMKDMDTMFNNAMSYNEDDSQIFKDAKDLKAEAQKLAEAEKKNPDSQYVMEDGRLPLPDGILHNGELWKVGDWVHIQNPNDVTKPIVAQIYRTWEDGEGQKWVNACWYYRPEQTVHQYEKHFFPNEVVKTGQYRDHHIEEVIDRCFVMFVTRYFKGRPRGFPSDKEVYVCEARYNEEKFKLNKIKTWASCLPDEVRDKDYSMDGFDAPQKIKKIPSPIKHLLKDEAKETDDLPKPTWGAENAPPIVGAVHRRPREENESPPPEPTPPPSPPRPVQPARPVMMNRSSTSHSQGGQGDVNMSGTTPSLQRMPSQTLPQTPRLQHQASQSHLQPQYHGASAQAPGFNQNYASHPASYTPKPNFGHQAPATQPHPNQYTTPHHSTHQAPQTFAYPPSRTAAPYSQAQGHGPRATEVFHLSNAANEAIPADVRSQFQQDDHGRVLFFNQPPVDPVAPRPVGLRHTQAYLDAKVIRDKKIADRKRKLEEEAPIREAEAKKRRLEEEKARKAQEKEFIERTMLTLALQLEKDTQDIYKSRFPDDPNAQLRARLFDSDRKDASIAKNLEASKAREEREAKKQEAQATELKVTGKPIVYKDDLDPRIPFN